MSATTPSKNDKYKTIKVKKTNKRIKLLIDANAIDIDNMLMIDLITDEFTPLIKYFKTMTVKSFKKIYLNMEQIIQMIAWEDRIIMCAFLKTYKELNINDFNYIV